jgi:dGTPase
VLAPYACHPEQGIGRQHPETASITRNACQRDRDRIIHSTAFRRLEHKTQVFVNHEGDLFRTRLTHSLEVAQIARSIARTLALNEDLVEAICLAHDLGHTPFGHAGQDALNACMKHHGGFEHNLQSLRVVDELEERYGAFDGLNLTFETREGILKHCSRANAQRLGQLGERFLSGRSPSLEAQLSNLADEIAYNNHDIDDGLRSGHLATAQLSGLALWDTHYNAACAEFPDALERRQINETIRRMISAQIEDLTAASRAALAEHQPQSVQAVRAMPVLIRFSAGMAQQNSQLKEFLSATLYRHYQVRRMSNKAGRVVSELFEAFAADAKLLPPQYQVAQPEASPRRIADYIAGMTDRYALREHRKLFSTNEMDTG